MNTTSDTINNIPLESVNIPLKQDKCKKKNQNKLTNYIQCFLPLICILELLSIVSICVCFYLYKVTLDDYDRVLKDYDKVGRDFQILQQDFENKIRYVELMSKNLSIAKANLYEYDDYSSGEKEEPMYTAETPPLPIGPASEELNNYRPNKTVEVDRDEDDYSGERGQKKKRSAYYQQDDKYGSIDQAKNDAEEDYGDLLVPKEPKIRRKEKNIVSKHAEIGENVKVASNITSEHVTRPSTMESPGSRVSSYILVTKEELKLLKEELSMNKSCEPSHTIAVHLKADHTKSKGGNYRIKHLKGQIIDWVIDSSINTDERIINQHFKLENGYLHVKQAGLYFVYAQIYYSTNQDTSGFNVLLNKDVMMRCITTGFSSELNVALHSCYSARLIRISQNDVLSIQEPLVERHTIFEETRSFFGLYRVG